MKFQQCMFFAGLGISLGVSSLAAYGEPASGGNPFNHFFGEWTLKDDTFQQVWDGKTVETLKIPNHYTKCNAINTEKSVLCVVDAGDFKGHILWTYNSDKNTVHHLSHFGSARNGVGAGELDKKSNLTTKVSFQGEPEGSYRVYEYKWITKDEYSMLSTQYSQDGKPTGNWYGGTFVRILKAGKTESK